MSNEEQNGLGTYEGRDVVRTAIAIRNAGDGLSEALGIAPQTFGIGDRVFVLLECEVKGVDYEPVKNKDVLTRKHILKAGAATMVDEAEAKPKIDYQRDLIQQAKDSVAGQGRLDPQPAGEEPSLHEFVGDSEADCAVCSEALGHPSHVHG